MTTSIVYDNRFNWNEWFVIVGLLLGGATVVILPRRFSRKLSVIFFLFGVTSGSFFDLTLGVLPVSFYDVGDESSYQFMDFLSLIMYGPFSYLFFYLYDFMKVRPKYCPLYILGSALVSLGFESIGYRVGVFHYSHGYGWQISFIIYLVLESLWLLLFYLLRHLEARSSV